MSLKKVYAGVKPASPTRHENDHYPTAPVATFALTRVERLPQTLWEPAAGRGWMSRELELRGFDVVSTDLMVYNHFLPVTTGYDFLNGPRMNVEGVVTNPPFARNGAEAFIRRAIVDFRYEYAAFLCRLTFAESMRRYALFTEFPPTRVHVFSGRFHCSEDYLERGVQLGGMIAYAWWVWDRRETGPRFPSSTSMRWIDTAQMMREWQNQN